MPKASILLLAVTMMARSLRSIARTFGFLALGALLTACPQGGSTGGSVPTAQTGASMSGTVSGTRIVAVNSSDQIVAEDDTAGRTPNA